MVKVVLIEHLATGFVQRTVPGLLHDPSQFPDVDLNPWDAVEGNLHTPGYLASSSRNRGVNGKPSTCLTGKRGFLLGAFLPRPVVRPSTIQFAAR